MERTRRGDLRDYTAVILAGGFGTRLSEVTVDIPKPMVNLAGIPLLVHIMDSYAQFGVRKFIVLGGYKVDLIRQFFLSFSDSSRDFSVNLGTGEVTYHSAPLDKRDWEVTILDTGLHSMTGGRVLAARDFLPKDLPFFLTYGDGLSNINFQDQLEFHESHGKLATVTAISQPSKFGKLTVENEMVTNFSEKPIESNSKISGGFFILDPKVTSYIPSLGTTLEQEPLGRLAEERELAAYSHADFWFCMDTARDLQDLRNLVASGEKPWLSRRNA